MSNNTFSVKINESDLINVKDILADIKGAGDRVIVRATNKTFAGVRTDASREIGNILNAQKSAIDDTFKITKMSTVNSPAMIESTGDPVALINFKNTRQTKQGVSVQVRKDKPRQIIVGAFIAKMKSSHKGVFWRVDENYKAPLKDKLVKKPCNKRRKIMVQRLQIQELYAPRIPDYLGKDPIITIVLNNTGNRLSDNLNHETDFELSKYK